MTNSELQQAIDSTFAACNSTLQEHISGGKARGLAVEHLKHLYEVQRVRCAIFPDATTIKVGSIEDTK